MCATGYSVSYPYMEADVFEWNGLFPELYLSAFHRAYDSLCCLGLHQSFGSVYEFSNTAADMMCNFIRDQRDNPERAQRFHALKQSDQPNLGGGIPYIRSARHQTHIENSAHRGYSSKLMRKFNWKSFGLM